MKETINKHQEIKMITPQQIKYIENLLMLKKEKKEKRTLHMNKYKKKLHFSSLIFHPIYNVTLNFWNAQFTSQQK